MEEVLYNFINDKDCIQLIIKYYDQIEIHEKYKKVLTQFNKNIKVLPLLIENVNQTLVFISNDNFEKCILYEYYEIYNQVRYTGYIFNKELGQSIRIFEHIPRGT